MQNRRRLTTVHDFAALRLHPDGTRVPTDPGPSHTAKRLHPSNKHLLTQDTQGNWIAKDAAGLGRVKRKRAVVEDDEGDVGEDGAGEETDLDEGAEGSVQGHRKKRRGRRSEKKKAFENDMGFLDDGLPSVRSETAERSDRRGLPVPSSDLLKTVHCFASHYYTSHGMLTDKSREYRREKLERRQKRMEADDLFAPGEEDSDEEADRFKDREGEEPDEPAQDEDDNAEAPEAEQQVLYKAPEADSGQDMYKVMDGSALVAISMLLQEHVASLVKPYQPPGWEEAYALVTPDAGEDVGHAKGKGKAVIDEDNEKEDIEENAEESDDYSSGRSSSSSEMDED